MQLKPVLGPIQLIFYSGLKVDPVGPHVHVHTYRYTYTYRRSERSHFCQAS
jgi:hypothetical protein